MDTIPVAGRADLTDAQWAVLEPLLPKGTKPGRPPKWSKRQLIDGIRWRVRRVAGACGCGRVDLLGRQRGFHHRAGAPACRWRPQQGTCNNTRPVGVSPSRPTMGWDGLVAG